MINRLIKIGLCIAILTSLFGCVKDGVEECPEGTVRLNYFAERFRNQFQDPLADVEEIFSSRVSQMRYYLYQDGVLARQGIIDRFAKAADDHYTFDLTGLEYGDYKMVVVANSTKTALSGDEANADNMLLTFPGCNDTEDYFTSVFPFTVSNNDTQEYNVGLLRTHGVIRYTFKNLPEDISDIEVVMRNVSNEKWVTGDYATACEASRRYVLIPIDGKAAAEDEDYVIGTFPTLTGERSAYYLNLYKEGQTIPYVEHLVSDTLTVVRNQLLDIEVTFNDGGISFEVNIDSSWNGSSPGGETELD